MWKSIAICDCCGVSEEPAPERECERLPEHWIMFHTTNAKGVLDRMHMICGVCCEEKTLAEIRQEAKK